MYLRQMLAHLKKESFYGCSQQHCLNNEILEITEIPSVDRRSKKCSVFICWNNVVIKKNGFISISTEIDMKNILLSETMQSVNSEIIQKLSVIKGYNIQRVITI